MEEEYDVVILGTGIKQCVLSGLLSVVNDKKVLLVDKNGYYGGDGPTLRLQQLFEYFGRLDCDISDYGKFINWNVDLITKLLMTNGVLFQMLVKTGVAKYIDFKAISRQYVCKTDEQGVAKVLRRSHKLISNTGFGADVQNAFGHSVSLTTGNTREYDHQDRCQPPIEYLSKERRYSYTFMYPFVYPISGLAGIQEGFSRLTTTHGGRVMLQQEYEGVTLGDEGQVTGVICGGNTIKCKQVVADPSYFPEKCEKVGQVVRAICLLRDAIPNTDSSESCEIIIPHSQLGRENDISIVCLSSDHNVCDNDWHVATVSTTVETDSPEEELDPGIKLLGPVQEKFVFVSDLYEPIDGGSGYANNGIFVCSGYDATPHFDTTTKDIISIYEHITGVPLDFSLLGKIPEDFQFPKSNYNIIQSTDSDTDSDHDDDELWWIAIE